MITEHEAQIHQLTAAHDANTKKITAQLNEGLQKKYADDMNQVRTEMMTEVMEMQQKSQAEVKALNETIGKKLEKEETKKYSVDGISLGDAVRKLGGEVETKMEEIKQRLGEIEALKKEVGESKKGLSEALA